VNSFLDGVGVGWVIGLWTCLFLSCVAKWFSEHEIKIVKKKKRLNG
jgi:hypothetical protein